ncbi:MAG: TIGR03013 family PEP-CTERM/XrtA system glycosyltransferase [Sulfuricella sp.]|nr:TIGR03013 family PEP-CTERM/XrtA system glycosyltransferase [Sulfuricella sp.]
MIRIFSHYISKMTLFLVCLEGLLLIASIYLGVSIRFSDGHFSVHDAFGPLWPKAVTFAFCMIMVMAALGLYQAEIREGIQGILLRLGIVFVFGLGVMSLVFYLVPSMYLGRGVFGIAYVAAFVGVLFGRLVFFTWNGPDLLKPRILVLGTGSRAAWVDTIANTSARRGLTVVGFLPLDAIQHYVQPSKVLSAKDSLMALVRRYGVNEIVVAVRQRRGGGLPMKELLECKLKGVRVIDLSSFIERERGQVRLESLNASWMIMGEGFRQGFFRDFVKRMFDLGASLSLLLVASPVMLLAALAILLEDGAPVLYRQERVGQGGRAFTIYKFRSMRVDAEGDGRPRWAGANDDRTTRVGRIIRKLRIDELPQVFNVLKGEMSFVGPRPERPYFVDQLVFQIPYYAARHSIKPGITGWAQVRYAYGASLHDATEKLQYDLYYVKNHSLFLDIMILIDTVQVVLLGKGAR